MFVAVAGGLCLAMALALRGWELTPLLAALVPTVAVVVTAFATQPGEGRRRWAGLGVCRPTPRGLLVALALPTAVGLAGFAIAAAVGVLVLPSSGPALGEVIADLAVALPLSCLLFLGEEIGWRGYLLPRLAVAMSGRCAALATGAVHAAFHLPLLLLTTYQGAGSRWIVVPLVMVTITAAGVPYAWLRWSTGGIVPVALMHATFNEAMQRGAAVVVATSPAALAYTTTETGVVTAVLMVALAGYLLTRSAPVFRAGAEESRALFARPVAPAGAGDGRA